MKVWWLVKKSVFRFRKWNVSLVLTIMVSSVLHDWLAVNLIGLNVRNPYAPLILNFAAISIVFFSLVAMRITMEMKNFALLKVFGATNWLMFKYISLELLMVSLIGLILGKVIVLFHFPHRFFVALMTSFEKSVLIWGYIFGLLVLAFFTALFSLWRVSRIDPYMAIRK